VTTGTVTVGNALGIHARAAARFVEVASRFSCSIRVAAGSRSIDGKSILGLLLLAAGKGTTLTIEASGPGEADAVRALANLLELGFEEP
jgi:phosphocarrier protein